MPQPDTKIPPGRWLVPTMKSARKHYFPNGERFSFCGNAKRDTARTSKCSARCTSCVRVMESKK